MANRTVAVVLEGKTSGFVAGMKQARDSARQTANEMKNGLGKGMDWVGKNEKHINTLSNSLGILGVAMVGAAGLAINAFMGFDKQMSAVQAATHESAENMNLLRNAAREAGADTVFNAQESAQAIEELAKAGVSTSDILGGALTGALDLAASGEIGVGDAAEYAATAMTQFNLSGQDVPHIADLLAAGAGKAQGGVEDMSMALKQSGLVASQTGLSIEETTGALAAFASAGLVGSDSGTSFKSMLQRLTPQSARARELMQDLGISAYDASGNFVGLTAFAGNLRSALETLTPQQRNAALATIFGSDAVRAAAVIYEQGATGVQQWIDNVNDTGYAAETAALKTDNLAGDIERLGGAFEDMLIGAGEGSNGPLRILVQGLTSVIDAVASLPAPLQQAGVMMTGVTGILALGAAGAGKLVVGLNDARNAMKALGANAKTVKLAVAGVGAAVAIATVGLTAWAGAQANAEAAASGLADTLDDATGRMTAASREWITNNILENFNADDWRKVSKEFGISIDDMVNAAMKGPGELDKFVKKIDDLKASNTSLFAEWDDGYQLLTALASTGVHLGNDIDAAMSKTQAFNEAIGSTPEQVQRVTQEAVAVAAAVTGIGGSAQGAALGMQQLSKEQQKVREEWREAGSSFSDISGAFEKVSASAKESAERQAEASKSASDSWEDFYNSSKVSLDAWAKELQKQAEAHENWAINVYKAMGQGASQSFIDELAKQGADGQYMLDAFVNGTQAERDKIVSAWERTGGESGQGMNDQIAIALEDTRYQKVMSAAMSKWSDNAVEQLALGLLTGSTTVEEAAKQLGINIDDSLGDVEITADSSGFDKAAESTENKAKSLNILNPKLAVDADTSRFDIAAESVNEIAEAFNGVTSTSTFDANKRPFDAKSEDVALNIKDVGDKICKPTFDGQTRPYGQKSKKVKFDLLSMSKRVTRPRFDGNTAPFNSKKNSVNNSLRALDRASAYPTIGVRDRASGVLEGLRRTVQQIATSSGTITMSAMAARATGGPIFGPGTETSDSIPALLSNNEHVWAAREVKAVGGHAAMYALRRAALNGSLALAGGGPAVLTRPGEQFVPTHQQMSVTVGAPIVSQSTVAAAMNGMNITLTVDGKPMRAVMQAVAGAVVKHSNAAEAAAIRAGRRI